MESRIYTDSSAAKASVYKPGLMHMKHMQMKELFLKQIVLQGLVIVEKINTQVSPVDVFTKAVKKKVIDQFCETLLTGKEYRDLSTLRETTRWHILFT